jgi:hypothetical protein
MLLTGHFDTGKKRSIVEGKGKMASMLPAVCVDHSNESNEVCKDDEI